MASLTSSVKHLWIALTDPDENGHVVVANVTSQRSGLDQSCVLNVGDHPAVKHESVVNYAEAMISSDDAIARAARANIVQWDEAVSGAVLARVQAGAIASPHTEPAPKGAVMAALGLP